MPAYHFIAINSSGQEQKGVIEAESEKHARQLLRDKSFVPVKVRPAQEKKGTGRVAQFSALTKQRGLSSKELALFTRQFAHYYQRPPIEEAWRR